MYSKMRVCCSQLRQIAPAIAVMLALAGTEPNLRAAGPLTRIDADKDENFPQNVTRLNFETDPAGSKLSIGQDVSKLFVVWGCTLETSFQNSFVGVNPYDIGGRSGGQCVATQKPLYQGIMTIRFCKPGDAKVAATVNTVGFWTSHVSPGGTKLEAYDKVGKIIGSISTTKHQRDFLAVKSKTPISFIRVVPDLEIDPDYAIDDLVFDTPRPLME